MQNTSLQANIARNSLQKVVVAKQAAADAKNARYICKNNTLSFWVFFLFRDKTYIRRIQNRTKQKGFIDRSRLAT